MTVWMFNCKKVSQRVSESLDHRLPLHQRAMIRLHLMMCKYCSRFRKQVLTLRDVCRLEDVPGEPSADAPRLSPEACQRIKNLLGGHMPHQR